MRENSPPSPLASPPSPAEGLAPIPVADDFTLGQEELVGLANGVGDVRGFVAQFRARLADVGSTTHSQDANRGRREPSGHSWKKARQDRVDHTSKACSQHGRQTQRRSASAGDLLVDAEQLIDGEELGAEDILVPAAALVHGQHSAPGQCRGQRQTQAARHIHPGAAIGNVQEQPSQPRRLVVVRSNNGARDGNDDVQSLNVGLEALMLDRRLGVGVGQRRRVRIEG